MALRVLLADESSTIKRVMQLALQDFGVEVKSVPVGLDVLPVTKTFKPDIIFADVLLSKRNGYEVCAELKADPETQLIPVILMWSGFMEIDDSKMNQAGPDARLEKPFDAEALRQMVQDLVPKTQSNPVSAYLQFPKMPEFTESAPTAAAAAKPASSRGPEAPMKPSVKIPSSAPVNFDQFDPNDDPEDSIFSVPEENTGLTRTTHDLPMIDSEDADPEAARLVADDEEFATVPLKSSQQKDQMEDDGWQRQDLKKFKIQIPEAPIEALSDDDFAKKFVIPQEELDHAHLETEGEFEELHFDNEHTATKISTMSPPQEDLHRMQKKAIENLQTKASPKLAAQMTAKISSSMSSGSDPDMIERVIREEAREVIESICWKVIPEMAERIVREEISKILRDVEKSN